MKKLKKILEKLIPAATCTRCNGPAGKSHSCPLADVLPGASKQKCNCCDKCHTKCFEEV